MSRYEPRIAETLRHYLRKKGRRAKPVAVHADDLSRLERARLLGADTRGVVTFEGQVLTLYAEGPVHRSAADAEMASLAKRVRAMDGPPR